MKRTLIALCMLALAAVQVMAAPAAAKHRIPAKSELTLSGNYEKPKGEAAVYSVDGSLAVPLNGGGNILLGPKLHYDSDDAKQAAGAVLEVNFLGTSKSGPYIGANGLYDLKEVAGTERYTVAADAGLKIALGKGGSGFKVFAEKPVAGRGKDETYLTYNAGLLVRF